MIRTFFRPLIHGIVSFFNSVSLAISRLTGQRYQLTLSYATYAPWLDDKEFMTLFDSLKDDTLTSLFQAWELWTMARQMGRLRGDFLEVGVWRGGSAVILGKSLAKTNEESTLFCCDSFSGLVKLTDQDPHNYRGELSNAEPEDVLRKMETFGVENFKLLAGVFPDETGESLTDKTFSLCHIDVDTLESAKGVFDWVWPKMLTSGVVIFQDYGFHRTPGISNLVDSLRGQPGMTVIHNLNGNALVFRSEELP